MTDSDRDKLLLEIHADVRAMAGRVDDHHETLFGNGHAGLKADVQRLDQAQQACPARLAYSDGRCGLRAAWAGVWVALAVAVLSAIVQVLEWVLP